MAEVLGAEVR